MFFFDPTFIILIPGLILAFVAQIYVQERFSKYSRIPSSLNMTGAQLAKFMLESSGIYDVSVERVPGNLTDHYDPKSKVVRLSDATYNSNSVAALGVVAHEIGHAIQHARKYVPLVIRNGIAPVVSFSSNLSWILFIIGFIFANFALVKIGIFLFSLAVLFSVITLPVEFDASRRAIKLLSSNLMMPKNEISGVKSVLTAAAMTYVASTLMAFLQLLRMLLIAGFLGGNKD
ncbi:peptidase [Thermosipho melanesiensis]|uniref:Peptidase, membrane zinc metallopeptidase, putative n=2 Tax=Thermosipho melanesiensis TaxID=46541 RepID=A6LN59_THEM4|nr:zinc metallopeptidase [Thermosipho melanesiensis]ABR31360.1 peptidase, membrane zinc metallopeptidase, putative [Thermosipho melanesiensis BI429]APT74420.1 peptidase [Thermosipho melanesiensis]OOC36383.1 peptidase [Thermosipho melanesiensis]OOC37201.1 peptidase [Thermosipho melanesiensis]OOC37953.1 peptidase [Thermosipho melanesiensis]